MFSSEKTPAEAILEEILNIAPFLEKDAPLPPLTIDQMKEIVGLSPKEEDFTEDNLNQAYRKRALLLHPDKHSGAEPQKKDRINHAFKIFNEARQQLQNRLKNPQAYQAGNNAQNDLFSQNPEHAWVKGLMVAQLREQFCELAGIHIQDVGNTADSNAKNIKRVFKNSNLNPEQLKRMHDLINLLFPTRFLTSYEISNIKTNIEWQEDTLFLATVINQNSYLKEKFSIKS
ncbi:MAG: DnaJ domain [Gammaproteobacteria bacterium]|jgi:hypothetical protein|nr:DnaJ domain [Gammaproteobacteria bacterium]